MSLFALLMQGSPEAIAAVAPAAEAAAHAAPHAPPGKFDAGEMILEHIVNSRSIELPPAVHVQLPVIHLPGLEIPVTRHAVMMLVASAILIFVGILAARIHRMSPGKLGHLIEMAILFIRDEIALPNIGRQGARYVPYLLTTFLFILTCNLLGMVPYGSAATGNISVTAALAAMAFAMIQIAGIREHGLLGHFKHLVPRGVPVWLVPIMLPVELIGMLAKPFALCMRLFANMMGGHIVLLSLLALIFILNPIVAVPVSIGFALFISLLELLVAFIQAYIFTMLTSLFIGMSVHPH